MNEFYEGSRVNTGSFFHPVHSHVGLILLILYIHIDFKHMQNIFKVSIYMHGQDKEAEMQIKANA